MVRSEANRKEKIGIIKLKFQTIKYFIFLYLLRYVQPPAYLLSQDEAGPAHGKIAAVGCGGALPAAAVRSSHEIEAKATDRVTSPMIRSTVSGQP